jgi:Cu-Zn family superoxide dismutase
MLGRKTLGILCATALGLSGIALAEEEATGAPAEEQAETSWRRWQVRATAEVRDTQGRALGTVYFLQGPYGVLIRGQLTGLPPGAHGFHIHEVGRCDPPDFQSAGGHYNPRHRQHGFLSPQGAHLGDLPNLWVNGEGEVTFDIFAPKLELWRALWGDGASIVVHAQPDDYVTDPAGNSGPRIGCGVLEWNRW